MSSTARKLDPDYAMADARVKAAYLEIAEAIEAISTKHELRTDELVGSLATIVGMTITWEDASTHTMLHDLATLNIDRALTTAPINGPRVLN